jgi:4-amino-4-deoxy-L-arabinose transferase-like glycosyltransferase
MQTVLIPSRPPSISEQKQTGFSILRKREFLLGLSLIIILAGVLYTTIAVCWPKFSRAEVFFAECAREMLEHANLVTPLYHGKPFFDKPILIYWLILGTFKTFGISHLTARLPSICGALLTIGSTAVSTALMAGILPGLLAAMLLASAFMFFSFAALCMSDMLLTLFDTCTLCFLYAGTLTEKRRSICWWLASVSMGLAFLTKGPVGLVLPAISFLLYLALTKQIKLIKPSHVLVGGLTAAIVASPWFFAAYHANGMGAMQYFFLHENLERFAGQTYDSRRPIWFMPLSLFTGFLPWSVFLPLALVGSIKRWRAGLSLPEARTELFLWLWIATVILFFSCSRGKIDYYALPTYPAAAALVAIYLGRWIDRRERPVITGGWGLSVCFVAAGFISAYFLQKIVQNTAPTQWLLMPSALGLTGLLIALSMYHQQYFKALSLAFTGVCLAAIGFSLQILPSIVTMQPVLSYISIIKNSSPDTRIGIHRTVDSWIDEVTFQTGREPIKLSDRKEMETFLSDSRPALLIVPKDKVNDLPPELMARLRVVDSRPFIAHSLNPGFAVKSNGKLTDRMPLLIISNRE